MGAERPSARPRRISRERATSPRTGDPRPDPQTRDPDRDRLIKPLVSVSFPADNQVSETSRLHLFGPRRGTAGFIKAEH